MTLAISCQKDALAKALQTTVRLAPSTSATTLPSLAHVLLEADSMLRLHSTDLKTAITLAIPATVHKPGTMSLPAKLLTDFVGSLPAGDVTLTALDHHTAAIASARYTAKIRGLDPTEFPQPTAHTDQPAAAIPAALLRAMINRTAFAASTDAARGPLQGVQITFTGTALQLVASDAYRLSLDTARIAAAGTASFEALVPAKALTDLARCLPDDDSPVAVSINANRSQILFSNGDLRFLATLLSDPYVAYQRIIPKTWSTRAYFDVAELLRAVRITGIFAKDSSRSMRLVVTPPDSPDATGTIHLSAEAQDIGDDTAAIDATIEGPATQIGFNQAYLAEALASLTTTKAAIDLTVPTAPALLRPIDGPDYQHIIMPVTLQR